MLYEVITGGISAHVAAELKLTAAVPDNGDAAGIGARHPGLAVYGSLSELAVAQPGLDILFALGSSDIFERARALVPEKTLVFGPAESVFFLTLFDPERLCLSCRLDLTRTRSYNFV